MPALSPLLLALIVAGLAALVVAGVSIVSLLRRRAILQRATGDVVEATVEPLPLMPSDESSAMSRRLARLAPSRVATGSMRARLLRAGIDSVVAPQLFFLLRVASLVLFPAFAWFIVPRSSPTLFYLGLGFGMFVGIMMPMALLDRLTEMRQDRIRRSVPDALDLLVVCVEAGISLDAAILRVSRELRFLHRELADELSLVNRMTNAGVTRERAIRGLWERTGVAELRSIASSIVQSEKLGTSIATVLRVTSDTLRRKRRQAAEKRAKQAPLKMTFPLILFILPALFIVVLGPAVFVVIRELSKI